MAPSAEAVQLAARLRDLRKSHRLTQAGLAAALGEDESVSVATISSWESSSGPKLPPAKRLRSYALLFAQARSADSTPHLVRERDLTTDGRQHFEILQRELLGLRDAVRGVGGSAAGRSFWTFDSGPITIVCPEVPADRRSPLAKEDNPNYTKSYRYADLDALIEVYAEIRARNPEVKVRHRLASEVLQTEMKGHLVILGGIGWHQAAPWLQQVLNGLPVQQVVVRDLENGEIFRTSEGANREFRPRWEDGEVADQAADPVRLKADQTEDAWRGQIRRELVADVALVARLRNPLEKEHTITICNGVYSRGVVGAALSLIDGTVRDQNEAYIAGRFPDRLFMMLTRIPIGNREAVPTDFGDPEYRLYEWPPHEEAAD